MKEFLYPVLRIIGIASIVAMPLLLLRYEKGYIVGNDFINLLVYSVTYTVLYVAVFYITGDLKQLLKVIKRKV